MGVHYTDIFNYYLGALKQVAGSAFVAEPVRRIAAGAPPLVGIEEIEPGAFRATGEDSLVAVYEAESGVLVQLTYVPSGPGHSYVQRSVHGRAGSMRVPRDRTGQPVVVQLGERTLSGAELRRELGGFELDGVTASFFGPEGTEYDLPFAEVDAATIGIELDDFAHAVRDHRPPEVDGMGGLVAVAGVWAIAEAGAVGGSVRIADVVSGDIAESQHPVDVALGLIGSTSS
jgi:predicted dehydrogenase